MITKQSNLFLPDGEFVNIETDYAAAYQSRLNFKITFNDGMLYIQVPDNKELTVAIGYGSVNLNKAPIDALIDEREDGKCDLAATTSVNYIDLEEI